MFRTDFSGRWQAVLLIDEANVFLGSRSSTHLTHNSVVAIFLRKLEYFYGLVFLTTSRHESFDSAFRSRIHAHLRYSDLEPASRLKVWNSYLNKASGTAGRGAEGGTSGQEVEWQGGPERHQASAVAGVEHG